MKKRARNPAMRTPFLWAGSKDRSYHQIRPLIPKFSTYYEPFIGGGSVYFRLLAERGCFPAFCCDIDQRLIEAYQSIRDDPDGIIAALPPIKDRDLFEEFRKSPSKDETERAAEFIYMNRNRFFGICGWMNDDRYARESVVARIRYFSPLMSRSQFSSGGFQSMQFDESDGFIFADPPYPECSFRYGMKPAEISAQHQKFYRAVEKSQLSFLWITKFDAGFAKYARRKRVLVKKYPWTNRMPGQLPHKCFELYAYRQAFRGYYLWPSACRRRAGMQPMFWNSLADVASDKAA